MSICVISDCSKEVVAHQLCGMHYRRKRLYGDPLSTRKRIRASCSIDGCEAPRISKGHCNKHSIRRKIYGDPLHPHQGATSKEKQEKGFWVKVEKQKDGCWLWLASKNNHGYGLYAKTRAHRFSWILHYGEIPDNLCVCHTCDNPSCVNPGHLFLGTASDNMRDMSLKGRTAGQKLTAADVLEIRRTHTGKRGDNAKLARVFNVSISNIEHIIAERTHKDVILLEERY